MTPTVEPTPSTHCFPRYPFQNTQGYDVMENGDQIGWVTQVSTGWLAVVAGDGPEIDLGVFADRRSAVAAVATAYHP